MAKAKSDLDKALKANATLLVEAIDSHKSIKDLSTKVKSLEEKEIA